MIIHILLNKRSKLNPNIIHATITYFENVFVFGSISSLIQISLNITEIFCLHMFLLFLSYCRIDFVVFSGNFICTLLLRKQKSIWAIAVWCLLFKL